MPKPFTCTVYDDREKEVAYVRTPQAAAGMLYAIAIAGWVCKWRSYVLWSWSDAPTRGQTEEWIAQAEKLILDRWTKAQQEVEDKKVRRREGKPRGNKDA